MSNSQKWHLPARLASRARRSRAALAGALLLACAAIVGCGFRQLEDDLGLIRSAEGTEGADSDSGTLWIDAGVRIVTEGPYECPGISSMSIAPAALAPGQAASLEVQLEGPPSSVQWTVTPDGGGTFSNESSLDPSFVCSDAGSVQVTVVASLLDGGSCAGVLFTSFTAAINCLEP